MTGSLRSLLTFKLYICSASILAEGLKIVLSPSFQIGDIHKLPVSLPAKHFVAFQFDMA
jgi:hypothetical protein